MARIRCALSVVALITSVATPVAAQNGTPSGWLRAGSHPSDYDMTLDRAVTNGNNPSIRLSSKSNTAAGFGTLMQSISADDFRGKRVRYSGKIRTANVTSWASLWVRVDGPCMRRRAFDNGQNRAAKGTQEWRDFSVVVDVAADAAGISFGQLLSGPGTAWFTDLKFTEVPRSTPSTAMTQGVTQNCGPRQPQNLDLRR